MLLPGGDGTGLFPIVPTSELLSVVEVPFPAERDPAIIPNCLRRCWWGTAVKSYIGTLLGTVVGLFRKSLKTPPWLLCRILCDADGVD